MIGDPGDDDRAPQVGVVPVAPTKIQPLTTPPSLRKSDGNGTASHALYVYTSKGPRCPLSLAATLPAVAIGDYNVLARRTMNHVAVLRQEKHAGSDIDAPEVALQLHELLIRLPRRTHEREYCRIRPPYLERPTLLHRPFHEQRDQ